MKNTYFINKAGKWFVKKNIIECLPNELEGLAKQSKKDYLTSRLAGLE